MISRLHSQQRNRTRRGIEILQKIVVVLLAQVLLDTLPLGIVLERVPLDIVLLEQALRKLVLS